MNEAIVVVVRGAIAFFTMLIFSRALGKQQISQLTFFNYILGITIGSAASSLTTDLTSKAWPHWIGLLVWTAAVLLFQVVTIKWRYMSKYVDGEPTIVIMDGKIMEEAMKKLNTAPNSRRQCWRRPFAASSWQRPRKPFMNCCPGRLPVLLSQATGACMVVCLFAAILIAAIVYAILIIATKTVTREEIMLLLPKGEKIAGFLHL